MEPKPTKTIFWGGNLSRSRGVTPEGWLQRGGTRGVASAQIPAPGPLVDTTKFWSTTGIDLHQNYQSYIT